MMGSDESHFNVSLIVRDKVTRQCPHTTTFGSERRAEADSNRGPSAYQPTALPLGKTGSRTGRLEYVYIYTRLSAACAAWPIRVGASEQAKGFYPQETIWRGDSSEVRATDSRLKGLVFKSRQER